MVGQTGVPGENHQPVGENHQPVGENHQPVGENHQPVASHEQTLSHNIVSSTPRLSWVSNSQH
jgi:hypothetical protein